MNPRVLVGFLVAACLPGQDLPGRVGRLSFLYGDVSFRPASVEEWAAATLNLPLSNADRLATAVDSQAEVHAGATAVHLAPQTEFVVVALDERAFRMQLSVGALNVRIPRMDEGESVEVETARGRFRLLRTGTYRVDVSPDGAFTSLTVRSGAAEAVIGAERRRWRGPANRALGRPGHGRCRRGAGTRSVGRVVRQPGRTCGAGAGNIGAVRVVGDRGRGGSRGVWRMGDRRDVWRVLEAERAAGGVGSVPFRALDL